MAVVLAIIGLLLAGLLLPLGAQIDQQNMNETQRRLESAREALTGFAIAHRRLPCPASSTSLGVEVIGTAFAPGGGACSLPWTGYIPAVTLGLVPMNSSMLYVDAWGNPIRYAVTDFTTAFTVSGTAGTRPFTSTDGMRAVYNAATLAALGPDLQVCDTATGITGAGAGANCSASNVLSNNSVAVIFSTGKNSPTGGTGTDEAANLNTDRAFISHTPTTAVGNEFDDVVLWFSSYLLYSRMIMGGALP
jgi:type II secretory pathway pseudopilin PulG